MDSGIEDSDSDQSEVDSVYDHSEVDSVSDHSEVNDLGHDSDHSEEVMDPEPEVNPAHAARAALLVARFAAAIQATKELQALQNRPRLLALEKLALKCLDTGDATTFLNQKRFFRMMPPTLLEKIFRECGYKWSRPPLVGAVMNPNTPHLSLHLDQPWQHEGEVEGWSLQELEVLCDNVAREGKTSLRSLEIRSRYDPGSAYPGLHSAQLGSLLLELRALTSLHLVCDFQIHEIDLLVSILASTNPDIRSLQLPNLSNKSLCTIAARWPQLESLTPDRHQFNSSHLEAVLPRLRNLKKLEIFFDGIVSEVMMSVARAHDPASPPYKLEEGFDCCFITSISSGDMVKLFTAFPALQQLTLEVADIPAVCAGLEGREHVHISELEVEPTSSNPRALEPLLALVGQHLTKLQVNDYDRLTESRVDLNMIGHYCPKLEDLKVTAGRLVSGDEFEVTETHFSKLRRCFLRDSMNPNEPIDLPATLVCRVLASPTLESYESKGVSITEEVMAALAAEREQGALSSLEELTVWHTTASVEVLAALASHAPRLQELLFEAPDEKDAAFLELKGVLTSFMQQGELNTKVSVED